MLIGIFNDEFYVSGRIKCLYFLSIEVLGQGKTDPVVAGGQRIAGQIGDTTIGIGDATANFFPLLLLQFQYDIDAGSGLADGCV